LLKGSRQNWHSTRDVFVHEHFGWVVSDDLRAALAVEEQAKALAPVDFKLSAKATKTGRLILAHTTPLAQVMPARPDFLPKLGAPALSPPAEESSEATDVIQQVVAMIQECVGQLM
jgi:hypothetical protein